MSRVFAEAAQEVIVLADIIVSNQEAPEDWVSDIEKSGVLWIDTNLILHEES
jgi:hypothetical protein